jgi:hypothetical protein
VADGSGRRLWPTARRGRGGAVGRHAQAGSPGRWGVLESGLPCEGQQVEHSGYDGSRDGSPRGGYALG